MDRTKPYRAKFRLIIYSILICVGIFIALVFVLGPGGIIKVSRASSQEPKPDSDSSNTKAAQPDPTPAIQQ